MDTFRDPKQGPVTNPPLPSSKQDFIEIYKEIVPSGNPTLFAELLFNMFDTDNSGSLDFEEFITAMSLTSKGDTDTKLAWAFKLYDQDGNGSICKEEMMKMIEATDAMNNMCDGTACNNKNLDFCKKSARERTDAIFEKLDTDGNGNLDMDEFILGCKQDGSLIQILSIFNEMAT